MKKIMKITSTALLATTFATASIYPSAVFAASNEATDSLVETSISSQNNMEKAVQAALAGPEIKKLEVLGHEFNVKPASIVKKDDRTIVNGQISHHLSWRPDDQVFYHIEIEHGEVKKVEIKIDRGGWTSISAPLLATLAQKNDIPVTLEMLQELGQKLGSYIDGKWEYAAEAIVSSIALYVE
ncbi:methyltransferase [Metasolibacillus meyeri]|uniref:Methyltransferase n=1 Tax=Metasolibacillus meyeri TaxID=1071052 RepID=A0AAW9NT06_9BACL|nr:methyltransferase [Metasolibacillus meyeri]MEC1180857.1 methyltransferase [Metasolibacillus meyeri]